MDGGRVEHPRSKQRGEVYLPLAVQAQTKDAIGQPPQELAQVLDCTAANCPADMCGMVRHVRRCPLLRRRCFVRVPSPVARDTEQLAQCGTVAAGQACHRRVVCAQER